MRAQMNSFIESNNVDGLRQYILSQPENTRTNLANAKIGYVVNLKLDEMTKMLLNEFAADPNEKDGMGRGLLYVASTRSPITRKDPCDKIARMLLVRGADMYCPISESEKLIFHEVCEEGYQKMEVLFHEFKVDVTRRDSYGRGPLEWSIIGDKECTFDRLVRMGLPLNYVNNNHTTPFIMAAGRGNTSIMKSILKNKKATDNFDINYKTLFDSQCHQGDTALHSACRGGHYLAVQLLLENGACARIKNSNELTPFAKMKSVYRSELLFGVNDEIRAIKMHLTYNLMYAAEKLCDCPLCSQ